MSIRKWFFLMKASLIDYSYSTTADTINSLLPWSRCTQTSLLTKIVSGFVTFSDSSILVLVCETPDY